MNYYSMQIGNYLEPQHRLNDKETKILVEKS